MIEYTNSKPLRIIGPQGSVLTREMLPPPDTRRWVASRKAQVVSAVDAGLLTLDQALARYDLSLEEFCSWRRAMDRAGVAGLRATWAQASRATLRRHQDVRPAERKLSLVTH
jgi:hypothetical protein